MASIFDKQAVLKPSAMVTVADRRFDDAKALVDTGDNRRANGAAYLAGFVIEILLKARLVEMHPAVARKRQHEVTESERELWRLIWKQHDLDDMLSHLPELQAALLQQGNRHSVNYLAELKKFCGTWTIQARYSSRTITMREARRLVETVRLLKEQLR